MIAWGEAITRAAIQAPITISLREFVMFSLILSARVNSFIKYESWSIFELDSSVLLDLWGTFLGGIPAASSSLNKLVPQGFLFSMNRLILLNWDSKKCNLTRTHSWGASLDLISNTVINQETFFLIRWQASGSNLNPNEKREKVWEFRLPYWGWSTIRINLYPSQEVFYWNSEGLAIFTSSQDFQYKACSVWTHRVITYRLTSKSCLNI